MAQTVDLESVALVETRDDASRARVRPPNGMRTHVRLAVALIALASAAKGVVQAGDSNFDRLVLGSGKNAFVKFLAPW